MKNKICRVVIMVIVASQIACASNKESSKSSENKGVLYKQLENSYYPKVNYEKPSKDVREAIVELGNSYNLDEQEFRDKMSNYVSSGIVEQRIVDTFSKNCGYFDNIEIREEAYDGESIAFSEISYADGVVFMKVSLINGTDFYKCYIENGKITEVVKYKYII